MATNSAPFCGYVRVSQVAGREGERFQSPTAQREAIERWAEYRGVKLSCIEQDLDRSGGTLAREGLQRIIKRIEAGECAGIVVSKLDRLSRSVIDGLQTIEQLNAIGGEVVSTSQQIDTTTSNGRLQLGMFLLIAQWYRETATENWEEAQERAFSRGALPGRTPYGCKRLDDGTVALDPQTAQIVERMVSERADGKGWRSIAADLTRDEIATPNGNSHWSAPTVQGIVKSEACLGVWTGPRGMRLENAWPAMVDRATWDRAQMVKGKRDDTRQYQDRLFAGIARCANCRRTLKRTTNQNGTISYGCVNRSCSARSSISALVLDNYVSSLIDDRLATLRFQATDADDGEYQALQNASKAAQRELEAWRDDTELRSALGEHDYRAGLLARAKARDQAEQMLNEYMQRTRSGLDGVKLPDNATVSLSELTWPTRRKVAESYLHALFIRRSARRGPWAAQDAQQRIKVEWNDDRERSMLPTPQTGVLAPIAW